MPNARRLNQDNRSGRSINSHLKELAKAISVGEMSLSDQITKGQEKLSLLVNGLQELNQDRLMQEEDNTLGAIAQTFDLLIQILVERRDDLILKTREIYKEASSSLFQRRKDVQAIITDIQMLEEESTCNKATDKPLFQVEADINNLKKKYDELLQAADNQLEEIRNPVCNFEFDQEALLKGFLDIPGGDIEEISKDEKIPKRQICKSQSQSINNDSECPSPDIETSRPNTSVNMGPDTPTLGSPDKRRRTPLTMREYYREPSGHNRSTPYLENLGEYPDARNQYSEENSHTQIPYMSLERRRCVNGDAPFVRRSIANRSNLTVIQTNYPNNTYSSPQLGRKGGSVKINKNLKKVRGEMENSAVGMGVRRVNSCDATEIIDSNPIQRIRGREKLSRKDSDAREENSEVNGRKKGDRKDSLGLHRSKKSSDSKTVRDMVKMFSLNSKQRCTRTETKI